MTWDSEYLIPLYNALLIPAAIFVIGLLIEGLERLLAKILARLFGGRAAFFICNRLTFIGTVHHELAHAVFAFLSGAKVVKVELFKVRGEQLGCVEYYPRGTAFTKSVQMALSGIAPVICGGVSLCVISWAWRYHCTQIWQYIVLGYLFISIFLHMNMSTQDVKNAIKGMPLTVVICYVVFLLTGISLIG